MHGAVLLTAVLLFACLNEIIAGFLVIIPVVDTLIQRGWDLRYSRWIAWHGLAAPIALVFLEGVVNRRLVAGGTDPEGASHLSMLVHYVGLNDFSTATTYWFSVNWLFFNIAAPTPEASHVLPIHAGEKYFEPTLANYFLSPVSASLVAVFGVMLVAIVLPAYRARNAGNLTGILPALGVYALVRGTFFLIVYPRECLLFASGVNAGPSADDRHTVCGLDAAGQATDPGGIRYAPIHRQRDLHHRPVTGLGESVRRGKDGMAIYRITYGGK